MEQRDEFEDSRSLTEVIIHTANILTTTLVSLAGNSLIFVALYRNRRLRTVTNFYVLSLAIADVMAAFLCFPFHIVASALRRWPFGFNLCQYIGFTIHCWAQVSICILTLASINRYYCVTKPQKYPVYFSKKNTILSILIVWIVSFIETLIFVFSLPVIYRWSFESLYCRGTNDDKRMEKISYIFFGSFFILLMSLVIFCYVSVYRVVRRHNTAIIPSLQQSWTRQRMITAQEIKTSRILFAAVLGFCVCWIPLIAELFLVFGCDIYISSTIQCIFMLFTSFSSWINPIIYGVMNRAMRKEFYGILNCRKED